MDIGDHLAVSPQVTWDALPGDPPPTHSAAQVLGHVRPDRLSLQANPYSTVPISLSLLRQSETRTYCVMKISRSLPGRIPEVRAWAYHLVCFTCSKQSWLNHGSPEGEVSLAHGMPGAFPRERENYKD